ncbi:MAG TPA: PAS domain-containing protein [Steroidobacteraceae bacterium]|nr:PAS domain-containing protein [Steroidobacteraceae bacterium]
MNWSQMNLWAPARKFAATLRNRMLSKHRSSRGTLPRRSGSDPVFHAWNEYEPIGAHRAHQQNSSGEVSERVRQWRRRVLLKKGVLLHQTLAPKAVDASLAILDEFGLVVAWYDRNRSTSSDEVIGKHLTQFYIRTDVASAVPAQALSAAVTNGSNTRCGWRRHVDGRVFWGITVITPIASRSGRLQGYAHLTTEAEPPWEGPPLNSIRSRVEAECSSDTHPSDA